jgi:hypothetical protein
MNGSIPVIEHFDGLFWMTAKVHTTHIVVLVKRRGLLGLRHRYVDLKKARGSTPPRELVELRLQDLLEGLSLRSLDLRFGPPRVGRRLHGTVGTEVATLLT